MADEDESDRPRLRRMRDRPDVVATQAQRINTGHKKVYVRIGIGSDGQPLEVFIDTGVSGGYSHSWSEGLAKTISNALQSGTPPMEIADDLLGISSGKVAADNGDNIYSPADAVGIAIVRFVHDRAGQPVRGDAIDEDTDDLPAAGTGPIDVSSVEADDHEPERPEEEESQYLFEPQPGGNAP